MNSLQDKIQILKAQLSEDKLFYNEQEFLNIFRTIQSDLHLGEKELLDIFYSSDDRSDQTISKQSLEELLYIFFAAQEAKSQEEMDDMIKNRSVIFMRAKTKAATNLPANDCITPLKLNLDESYIPLDSTIKLEQVGQVLESEDEVEIREIYDKNLVQELHQAIGRTRFVKGEVKSKRGSEATALVLDEMAFFLTQIAEQMEKNNERFDSIKLKNKEERGKSKSLMDKVRVLIDQQKNMEDIIGELSADNDRLFLANQEVEDLRRTNEELNSLIDERNNDVVDLERRLVEAMSGQVELTKKVSSLEEDKLMARRSLLDFQELVKLYEDKGDEVVGDEENYNKAIQDVEMRGLVEKNKALERQMIELRKELRREMANKRDYTDSLRLENAGLQTKLREMQRKVDSVLSDNSPRRSYFKKMTWRVAGRSRENFTEILKPVPELSVVKAGGVSFAPKIKSAKASPRGADSHMRSSEQPAQENETKKELESVIEMNLALEKKHEQMVVEFQEVVASKNDFIDGLKREKGALQTKVNDLQKKIDSFYTESTPSRLAFKRMTTLRGENFADIMKFAQILNVAKTEPVLFSPSARSTQAASPAIESPLKSQEQPKQENDSGKDYKDLIERNKALEKHNKDLLTELKSVSKRATKVTELLDRAIIKIAYADLGNK